MGCAFAFSDILDIQSRAHDVPAEPELPELVLMVLCTLSVPPSALFTMCHGLYLRVVITELTAISHWDTAVAAELPTTLRAKLASEPLKASAIVCIRHVFISGEMPEEHNAFACTLMPGYSRYAYVCALFCLAGAVSTS